MNPLRRCMVATVLIAAVCGGVASARAQQPDTPEPTREQLQLQISIMRDYIKKLENATPAKPENVDPRVQQAYNEAQLKQYQTLLQQADFINQSFYEHRIMVRTSLFLVVLVVIAGVSFSAVQLWQGLGVAGSALSSDLEISASKIRLTSSVIGVIVLTISLAFFYVFVTNSLKVELAGGSNPVTRDTK